MRAWLEGAVLGQFDDGVGLIPTGAADGVAAQQIACLQIAAAHGVLSGHLRHRPLLMPADLGAKRTNIGRVAWSMER